MFRETDPILKLALGRGKEAKRLFSLRPLDEVREQLQRLPKDISLKYQLKALRKAAKPGRDALEANVRKLGQVTGNLLASITKRERRYTNNRAKIPVGVVVIGFRRPTGGGSQSTAQSAFGGSVKKGPNRAYHSHLVEFGTTGRRTPGKSVAGKRRRVILGGRIKTIRERTKTPARPRGILTSFKERRAFKGKGQYPIDFIARGSVKPMPAFLPLTRAFAKSKSQMTSILDTEMRKSLQLATKAFIRQARKNRLEARQ